MGDLHIRSMTAADPQHAAISVLMTGVGSSPPTSDATTRHLLAETGSKKLLGVLEARGAGDDVEIIMLAITPAHRRQGVASALCDALLKNAAAANANRILLEVAADNHAARALYEGLGFTMIGVRAGYYRKNRSTPCDAQLLALDVVTKVVAA